MNESPVAFGVRKGAGWVLFLFIFLINKKFVDRKVITEQ